MSKEAILGRIREALRMKAPLPGHHGDHTPAQLHMPAEFGEWLPPVGASLDARLELFAKNSDELKTEFHLLAPGVSHGEKLRALSVENGWRTMATHGGILTDAAVPTLGLPVLKTDDGYDVAEMERCDVGISECDALVAQTGSILITSRSAGGRALSILPPHHVVLATRVQMVPDLAAAYAVVRAKYGINFPSLISFITGPSRTGDIERILVLGAHGPKRLTVLCA